jgi:hypothetical protein
MPGNNLIEEELTKLFHSMEFPYRCHKDELYDRVEAIKLVTGSRCSMRQVEKNSEYYDLSMIEGGE